jgi:uncharacterized protein YdaU (DUF1376 family)
MPKKVDEWMPFLIGRYLGDTMHLTYDQHGPYILLLLHYWRTGPLPNDDRKLAAITRVPLDIWKSEMAETLREFFTLEADGLLHQKRADEEIARRKLISDKRSMAGKAGADAKYGEDVSAEPPVANASGLLPGCEPFATVQVQQQETQQGQKEVPPPSVGVARAPTANGTRLPANWQPSADGMQFTRDQGLDPATVLPTFIDYWVSQAGAKGRKTDWEATWRNWCRRDAERLKTRPAGTQAMLLPFAGGKAADPNDAWGIEAWCKSVGATPITNAEHLKRGKWMHVGCIIDSVARNVAREAGFLETWRGDWSPLLQWLQAGCGPSEHIYPAIKSSVEFFRSRGNPATSLNAFTTAVMQRRAA